MAEPKVLGRVLLIPRGEYDENQLYNNLDWVRYNGKSWVCKKDNTIQIEPDENENWTVLAQDGNGRGDMEKRIYDKNDDGVVDDAENALFLKNSDNKVVSADTIIENIQKLDEDGEITAKLDGLMDEKVKIPSTDYLTDSKTYKTNELFIYENKVYKVKNADSGVLGSAIKTAFTTYAIETTIGAEVGNLNKNVLGQIAHIKTQQFRSIPVNKQWGNVYESGEMFIDYSDLNLSSFPKAVFLSIDSDSGVLIEHGQAYKQNYKFYFVRGTSSAGVNVKVTALIII